MGMWTRLKLIFSTKASSAMDRAEDPRQVLDYAYTQQQLLLVKLRQGLVEVATSKQQLERQSKKLEARVPQLEDQAKRALGATTWRESPWNASGQRPSSSKDCRRRSRRWAPRRSGWPARSARCRSASRSSARTATSCPRATARPRPRSRSKRPCPACPASWLSSAWRSGGPRRRPIGCSHAPRPSTHLSTSEHLSRPAAATTWKTS